MPFPEHFIDSNAFIHPCSFLQTGPRLKELTTRLDDLGGEDISLTQQLVHVPSIMQGE
jgi:hypothetical protein